MDPQRLEAALAEEFDADEEVRRVIARQARDLADIDKLDCDRGHALTVPDVLRNLSEAPDDASAAERWNWWMGALDTAYGGYDYFTVRVVEGDEELDANR